MNTNSAEYKDQCLAVYLLDNPKEIPPYFKKNPKQRAKIERLLMQERAKRLVAKGAAYQQQWFLRKERQVRGNRQSERDLQQLKQQVAELEQQNHG